VWGFPLLACRKERTAARKRCAPGSKACRITRILSTDAPKMLSLLQQALLRGNRKGFQKDIGHLRSAWNHAVKGFSVKILIMTQSVFRCGVHENTQQRNITAPCEHACISVAVWSGLVVYMSVVLSSRELQGGRPVASLQEHRMEMTNEPRGVSSPSFQLDCVPHGRRGVGNRLSPNASGVRFRSVRRSVRRAGGYSGGKSGGINPGADSQTRPGITFAILFLRM
jgi:hypothetical protein